MSKWSKTELKSPWGRCMLTPPEEKDDIEVAAMRSDAETLRYLPYMPKSMSPAEWRPIREARTQNDEWLNLHIHLTSPPSELSSSTFVGQCGLSHIDLENRVAEAGIMVTSQFHRTGIATEALYLVLKHGFEHPELKLHRIEFLTASNNVQMKGWLEGLDMGMEYRKREAWSDGQGGWVNIDAYSILEGEWPIVKARMEKKIAARVGSVGQAINYR